MEKKQQLEELLIEIAKQEILGNKDGVTKLSDVLSGLLEETKGTNL